MISRPAAIPLETYNPWRFGDDTGVPRRPRLFNTRPLRQRLPLGVPVPMT